MKWNIKCYSSGSKVECVHPLDLFHTLCLYQDFAIFQYWLLDISVDEFIYSSRFIKYDCFHYKYFMTSK